MKPLDFVKHENGCFGIIKEGSQSQSFSIEWFSELSGRHRMLKNAWWGGAELSQLEVIGNLANFLAVNMCHTFGDNAEYANNIYKVDNNDTTNST